VEFTAKAKRMLVFEEGRREFLYDCKTGRAVNAPVGHITGGIGHNFEARPLSNDFIDLLFEEDLGAALEGAERLFPAFNGFPEIVQLAIVNLIFNVGEGSVTHFFKFCLAVKNQNWRWAGDEVLDSKYAREDVPERAERIALMLKEGVYPY